MTTVTGSRLNLKVKHRTWQRTCGMACSATTCFYLNAISNSWLSHPSSQKSLKLLLICRCFISSQQNIQLRISRVQSTYNRCLCLALSLFLSVFTPRKTPEGRGETGILRSRPPPPFKHVWIRMKLKCCYGINPSSPTQAESRRFLTVCGGGSPW